MSDSLDRLSIRGFKSIRELESFELRPLNVLVGANGAGKSNFISFFRMLSAVMDGTLNDYVRNSGGISDILYNGREATSRMEFETRFGPRGYRFGIAPGARELDFALVHEARYYKHGTSRWWNLGDSSDNTSLLARQATRTEHSDHEYSLPVYEAIRSWVVYHFHDTSENAPMRHAEIVEDCEILRSDAANLAPFLLHLRDADKKAYTDVLDACKLVAPYLEDFLLKPEKMGPKTKVSLSWRTKGSNYPMQPYHLSDGTLRFICLAAALLQPKPPSTLIIDEPELGLHPEAIRILAELVRNAATRTQIIIATQSPLLLDQFSVEDVVVVSREDGQSAFQRLNREDYNVWLEDYSVGQLWTKNVIRGGTRHE